MYQQERDKIQDEQWQKEYEESVRQFNENLAFQQAQAAKSGSRGGGGGGGRSDYDIVKQNLQALTNSGSYAETVQGGMAQIRAAVSAGMITHEQARELVKNNISSKR